jgi:hypothetical protein
LAQAFQLAQSLGRRARPPVEAIGLVGLLHRIEHTEARPADALLGTPGGCSATRHYNVKYIDPTTAMRPRIRSFIGQRGD